jgi:hypothetical protein
MTGSTTESFRGKVAFVTGAGSGIGNTRRAVLALVVFLTCLSSDGYGQKRQPALALTYDAQTRGPVPIPPSERGLQTLVAEPRFKVSQRQPVQSSR